MSHLRLLAASSLVLVVALASTAVAAAPTVRSLSVRGLQIAGTTTLVFDGAELLPNPRVVMSVPLITQTAKPNSTATRVEIDVTLDDKSPPGLYNLHLATDGGVSERIVVAIDRLPQRPFAASVESLPVALHGTLGGGTQRTTFTGRAGQSILCEVESQRVGAKLRPVLHLYDAGGQHLAWSLPSQSLRGDARLAATLPADGPYTVTLNDLQYNAPAPNHFRLRIGHWQFADFAFPTSVQRGTTVPVRLIGNMPADGRANLVAAADATFLPALPPEFDGVSGPVPAVAMSDLPELIEQPASAAGALQEFPLIPAAMNGWFGAAGEEDRYRLKVQADVKLRFELFASRLGAAVDGVLELRRENGAVLAAADDAPGTTDPLLEYTVPKDVDALVVAVKDAQGRGGESHVYRLLVTSPAVSIARPDFQLSVEQDRYNIPTGGRQVVRVRVDRRDYAGPIRVEFPQLPPGAVVEGAEVPAGANGKLISLAGAGESFGQFLTSIRGTSAADLNPPLTRIARTELDAMAAFQPWLADQVALALAARAGIGLDIDWQSPTDARLVLGGKFQTPVKCVRPAGFDGPVRLTLLTSQNPPQVNGKDDPNRTLRSESAALVEIPADAKAVATWDAKLAADKVLADAQMLLDKAVKAVADAQGAGGAALEAATKGKTDAEDKVAAARLKLATAVEAALTAANAAQNDVNYVLLVPSDLPVLPVELAFRAELLSRDKQRVLLTVCTPVRAVPVVNPLRLVYAGPAKAQAKLDPKTGASFKVAGKIERLEGMAGEVAVSASGLPAGVPVPKIVVKADQTDFELEFKFPATTPAGELVGIKLFATGKMTPQSPLEVRSVEAPVAVEILPPDASP